jgi:hypothetical protein
MALLDTILPQLALTAVKLVGPTATLRVLNLGTYDPLAGTRSGAAAPTDYSVACTPPQSFGIRVNGTTILESDRIVFIPALDVSGAALPVTPKPGMQLLLNSETWTVFKVGEDVYAGALPALYPLHLRK